MSYQVSKIDVPEKNNLKVIYLSGEIDESNLGEFKKEFAPLLEEEEVETYIMHIRDLQFINSMVIGYFAGMYSELREKNKKLMLAEGNEHILDILTLVGFTNLVEHHESLKEAIESLDL